MAGVRSSIAQARGGWGRTRAPSFVRSTQHEQEHGSQDEYGSQEKKEKIEKIEKKDKKGTISEGNRRHSPAPPVYPQNLLNVSHMHVECDGLDLIQWHLSESVSEARIFFFYTLYARYIYIDIAYSIYIYRV